MATNTFDVIEKVVLKKSHVPIRSLHTEDNPASAGENIVLWEAGQASAVPAVISTSSDQNQSLVFTVKNDPEYTGTRRTLEVRNSESGRPRFTFQTLKAAEGNANDIECYVSCENLDTDEQIVPIMISHADPLILQYDDKERAAKAVPLEIYVISPNYPPYFKAPGIPLPLLRIFVANTQKFEIKTSEQWIQWVTRICHGSQDPDTGNLQPTSNSGLKYNVWHGSNSFASGYDGNSFNLDAWLKARQDSMDGGGLSMVNCYDQAGILQIALS